MNSARIARCLLGTIVLLISFSLGCDPAEIESLINNESSNNGQQTNSAGNNDQSQNSTNNSVNNSGADNSAIIIGSFNIQAFGQSKMAKPAVLPVLIDIVRRFDVLAIQELRDIDQRIIPEFLKLINQGGQNYMASVGPRQGYVDSKTSRQYEEQMVYIYDANRMEIIGPSYVAQDRYKIMHRSPYVAHFRCRNLLPKQAFSFVLLNVHTDPDDTVVEFEAMQEIISGVFPNHPGEDDFIVLGDLNNSVKGFQKFRWMSNQFAAIPSHWNTNTRQDKSYDNIVFDSGRTAEFLNQAGVMNLLLEYKLNTEQALQVSDHMPVWAVFSSREATSASITQGPQVIR